MYIKKAQSGRSMIEMLGVLAIVGILSAGGIAGYSMAMQSYKTSALTEKVNLIAQQARVLYNGIYDVAAANTDGTTADATKMGGALIKAGLITDLNNPFGSFLEVAGTADPSKTFTVKTSAANVPAEACIKLLRTDWGTTGVFTSVQVTGKTALTSGGATPTSPADAATAISQCGGGNKQITWTFK
jgi:prepilin-type N-terminal cleavage/methylation domain-containing protein